MGFIAQKARAYVEWSKHSVLHDKNGEAGDVEGSNKRLYAALIAEFLGLLLFQLYGGEAHESVAAYGNGLTLAVLVYCTANVSGGHLNPAVTLATMITGHKHWKEGLLYMAAQFLGGIVGVLFQVALIPEVNIRMGNGGPGCFTHLGGTFIREDQLFGWETIMTFLLCAVVYSVAVTKPGFGVIGPLIVGYTLFASAFIGGPFTGAALNPARVLGPAIVYGCYWDTVFVYIAAELLGGVICALITMPLYGPGPEFTSAYDAHESQALAVQMAAAAKSQERAGLISVQADGRGGSQWDDPRY